MQSQSMEGFTEGANPGAFIAYIQAKRQGIVPQLILRSMKMLFGRWKERIPANGWFSSHNTDAGR